MKISIWEGVTNLNIHYISRQGMYFLSIEEISQCQTIDKAFLFDMNKAIESIKSNSVQEKPPSSKKSERKVNEVSNKSPERSKTPNESEDHKSRDKTPPRELDDEEYKVKQDFFSKDTTPKKKKEKASKYTGDKNWINGKYRWWRCKKGYHSKEAKI